MITVQSQITQIAAAAELSQSQWAITAQVELIEGNC